MDKNNIIEKLRKFLQNHPQFKEECEVIYLLVEIRKILDIDKDKDQDKKSSHQSIRFYCNWVLHVNLDMKNTTKFISNMFDLDIDYSRSARKIAREMKSSHPDFFKLNDFKNELRKFFKNHDLPLSLVDTNKHWVAFIILLLGIIEECPVVCVKSSKKIERLDLIKNKKEYYCYKFNLINSSDKPVIKLMLK